MMWELEYKESWMPNNWCFWTVLLEKTLESPLNPKKVNPFNPEGNKSWIFLERLMLKLKPQYSGYLMQRTESLGKNPDVAKDWRQEEKGHDRGWDGWMASLPDGCEFEQVLGVCEGQENLACFSLLRHKEKDRAEWLNLTECFLQFREFLLPKYKFNVVK